MSVMRGYLSGRCDHCEAHAERLRTIRCAYWVCNYCWIALSGSLLEQLNEREAAN